MRRWFIRTLGRLTVGHLLGISIFCGLFYFLDPAKRYIVVVIILLTLGYKALLRANISR